MTNLEEVPANAEQETTDAVGNQTDQEDSEKSEYPDPIPEDWKAGRAARAEQWFQDARGTSKQ